LAVRRFVLAFAALAVAVFGPQAVSAARAPSSRVPCGATIAADTVLRSDVAGCTGTALVIGRDGVRLDLNGHTVEGSIVATDVSDLQIRDGVVEGDVQLQHVSRATVRKLRVRDGSINCVRSAACTILKSSVTGGSIAIVESEIGVPNRVRANAVTGAPGPGIIASRTDTTSITANVVRHSGTGIEASHAADLRIARNVVFGNTGDGLSGSFGAAAVIVRNVIVSNGGDGISLRNWGGQTLIARNIASRNGHDGIMGRVVGRWAVVHNVADRNRGAGVSITGAVDDATLAGNRARRNGGLGIDAVPAVTDGGGNEARENGAPEQCTGVVCR
jgi:hypothetical protein